jgi:predicted ATPase
MIYQLEIENFSSIREAQVLDLTIAPNVPDPDSRFSKIFPGAELRAPKVLALYGPNASGKTTVLRALDYIASFIRDSAQRTVSGFACDRFNDEEAAFRPIRLAIEFGGVMDLTAEQEARAEAGEAVEYGTYRYDLEISVKDGVGHQVAHEHLRQRPEGKGKWQRVFERDGDTLIGSKTFPLVGYRHLLNTLKPNVSVISSFAQFGHQTAEVFAKVARLVFSNFSHAPGDDAWVVNYLKTFPDVVDRVNRDLGRIDIGVEGMRIVETATGALPMFRHAGLQHEMPWAMESHGTRAFIRMFPFLSATLDQGGVAILDEFDIAIHPLVLPDILRWFYDAEGRNPHDGQLWFSVHSASLLDDLTKEEVVLCEKDSRGRTRVFSLMDVRSVRRDDNLYRKYLSGAYGAVPNIG